MILALVLAVTAPQKPSALMPTYRWEAVATCAKGVVLARLPVHPGRLALIQDLGCGLDYFDIDGRAARFLDVMTKRFTLQRVAFWAVPLEWTTETRGFGACNKDGCLDVRLPVEEVSYPKSEITVSKKFMAPSDEQAKKIAADRIHIARAFSAGLFDEGSDQLQCAEQLFGWPFELPRPPDYTSVFGALRIINNATHTRHLGVDFDGKVGEPILAAQDGVVVLAEDLYYSGNSVFVSHGLGLFTTYFHMTQIKVKAGEQVVAGQLLGTIGKTGRVTGPHLHFSTKLWGHYFEPMELFELELSEID